MSRRAFVDANVILRFLTRDPPEQAAQSAALFDAVDRGEITLVLDENVLAECVWVLQSYYKYSPGEIAETLQDIVAQEGVEADDKPGLLDALRLFSEKNIDLADALTAVHMARLGIDEIYSFDTHFDRLEGISRRTPGE